MILIISICKEPLHAYEFVKPIEDILKKHSISSITTSHKELDTRDLNGASKIIIAGTSLQDNEFITEVKKFEWIVNSKKPILGICGGMQILSLVHGATLKHKKQIGYFTEHFEKDFLGLLDECEVYHLHNNYVTLAKDFVNYTKSKIPQAIKHTEKELYGVLFHPEVRNKELIVRFADED